MSVSLRSPEDTGLGLTQGSNTHMGTPGVPDEGGLGPCIGCGAIVSRADGPTHRYIGASPGCWALYGEVLAREYSDSRYGQVHQLTVDTYAVQHPGTPSPQSIQSVTLHLVGLYLVFGRGHALDQVAPAIQRLTAHKGDFIWLEPPPSQGSLTVCHVHAAQRPDEHAARVRQWGESVWTAWAIHHGAARRYAGQWLALR